MSSEGWDAPTADPTRGTRDETPAAPVPAAVDVPVGPTDAGSGAAVDVDRSAGIMAPTRASGAWTAAVGATVLLLALAIFVGQNTQRAAITFLAWHGQAPISVLLLVACVAGAGLVAVVGVARILQLHHRDGLRGARAHRSRTGDGGGFRTERGG